MIGYVGVRVQRLVRYLPDDAVIDVLPNKICDGVNALNILYEGDQAYADLCASFGFHEG